MEDFLRLNLNGLIGVTIFLIILIGTYVLTKPKVPSEYEKLAKIAFWGILLFTIIIVLISTVTQSSVNNVPRSTIDRSFILKAQQNVQENANTPDSMKGR
jgi:uncharacterized membrane protein YesL